MKKDTKEALEYRNLVGRKAKAEFRAKWAELKLEAAQKKAVKEQRHEMSEYAHAQHTPFKKLWDAEGSDQAGFRAI